ncbi:alpha/beta hydrolase [Mucisphaera calidilacus]|uniref:Alpha/beta hydrolase family protein n=1 Tax=Mucisphaera calidilacus TaxID=2527982 RepID=A0A518BY44_9BACT|nr:alpha/beta hydrolase [Mucisphaera calidilacus]QDU71895.1 Alpha/beta hydrolase family protein [Mucisphaera calidilacus]
MRILACFLMVICLMSGGCTLQRALIYHGDLFLPSAEDAPPEGTTELWLEVDARTRVPAFYWAGRGCTPERPGPAVIYFHGSAMLIEGCYEAAERYVDMGVSVLVPEFRGFGRATGRPTQANFLEDMVRFRAMLAERSEVDAERLVYHGRSLGSGLACDLAVVEEPAALVLVSPFTSMRAMYRRFGFPGSWAVDPFDNLAVVRGLESPLLVLHGTTDTLISIDQSRELVAAAADARLVSLPMTGHNDIAHGRTEELFWLSIEGFLREKGVIRR